DSNVDTTPGKKPDVEIDAADGNRKRVRLEYRMGDVDPKNPTAFKRSIEMAHVMHGLMLQSIITAAKLSDDGTASVSALERELITIFDTFATRMDNLAQEFPEMRELLGANWFSTSPYSFTKI